MGIDVHDVSLFSSRYLGFSESKATRAKQPVYPSFLKYTGFTYHQAVKEVVYA